MATTRRHFLQTTGAAGLASGLAQAQKAISPNDRIRIATIGHGGMGSGDTRYARSIPGVELVAVCDIYDGRLTRAKELYGPGIFTTRDYREVLARKDIDAVIIATPDHWHSRITVDALYAGKDVYCEKPMVQQASQGKAVIEAQTVTNRIVQVGSQYVSSLVYQKAREMLQSGTIGQLNMVEAWLDRNTAIGAWQYSIPPDASPANIDWDRFLGSAPKVPFEPVRLFRWRNYQDYGTGVAGDLFVHLLSGLHFATGSRGPNRVYASGGLRYWKDGRDVPDVMLATLDYPAQKTHPEFTLALRVNFKSGLPHEEFGFRFIGSEGVITTGYNDLTLTKAPPETEPGYTINTFPQAVQDEFLKQYHERYPKKPKGDVHIEKFQPPQGHDAHLEHHRNFYECVRSRQLPIEDAEFGLRAAGPALLANVSYFERRICTWNENL